MSNTDFDKSFEELFTECMYDIIREAGIALSLIQLERFRNSCQKSAKKLSLKIEQQVLDVLSAQQASQDKSKLPSKSPYEPRRLSSGNPR